MSSAPVTDGADHRSPPLLSLSSILRFFPCCFLASSSLLCSSSLVYCGIAAGFRRFKSVAWVCARASLECWRGVDSSGRACRSCLASLPLPLWPVLRLFSVLFSPTTAVLSELPFGFSNLRQTSDTRLCLGLLRQIFSPLSLEDLLASIDWSSCSHVLHVSRRKLVVASIASSRFLKRYSFSARQCVGTIVGSINLRLLSLAASRAFLARFFSLEWDS
ncbi:hypothetical protein F2Q69_00041711 [Brassica cretica]|uniref:Uncharacterized protein n=1 Tax=Brassica cretica TaxID=69181 RepID=A0A8S9NDJ5_BRACR|nr:hypothetical protein F2Q69_00041711 [Brassica cretica]